MSIMAAIVWLSPIFYDIKRLKITAAEMEVSVTSSMRFMSLSFSAFLRSPILGRLMLVPAMPEYLSAHLNYERSVPLLFPPVPPRPPTFADPSDPDDKYAQHNCPFGRYPRVAENDPS